MLQQLEEGLVRAIALLRRSEKNAGVTASFVDSRNEPFVGPLFSITIDEESGIYTAEITRNERIGLERSQTFAILVAETLEGVCRAVVESVEWRYPGVHWELKSLCYRKNIFNEGILTASFLDRLFAAALSFGGDDPFVGICLHFSPGKYRDLMVRIFRRNEQYCINATDILRSPGKLDAIDAELPDLDSCKKKLFDYFSAYHGGNIRYVVYFAWFVEN